MPRILCTLPNAGKVINGIKFSPVPNGMLSDDDLPDDVAHRFMTIAGYEMVGAGRASGRPVEGPKPGETPGHLSSHPMPQVARQPEKESAKAEADAAGGMHARAEPARSPPKHIDDKPVLGRAVPTPAADVEASKGAPAKPVLSRAGEKPPEAKPPGPVEGDSNMKFDPKPKARDPENIPQPAEKAENVNSPPQEAKKAEVNSGNSVPAEPKATPSPPIGRPDTDKPTRKSGRTPVALDPNPSGGDTPVFTDGDK